MFPGSLYYRLIIQLQILMEMTKFKIVAAKVHQTMSHSDRVISL